MKTLYLGMVAAFYFARYLAFAAVILVVIMALCKIIWIIVDKKERKHHD